MEKLRLVILTDAGKLLRWQQRCLEEIQNSGKAEIVLVAENPSTGSPPLPRWQKIFHYPWRHLLWRVFDRYRKPYAAMDIGYGQIFDHVPVRTCRPLLKGRWSHYFGDEDLENIRQYRPDVVLRFGYRILKGDILQVARYGVWSFHHSDPSLYRGGPAFFWEILRNDPVTGAVLQRLNEKIDSGIPLRTGRFKTSQHSYRETADNVLFGAAVFVREMLVQMTAGQTAALPESPLENSHLPMNKVPGNYQMLRFLVKTQINRAKLHLHELFRPDHWHVGSVAGSAENLLQHGTGQDINWLPLPERGNFIADPFPLPGSQTKLLCEMYPFSTAKGKIAEVDLLSGACRVVLSSKTHFSYPGAVRNADGLFLLPENFEEGHARLYRYDPNHRTWEPDKVLFENREIIDPTLFYHEGKWWLFCTLRGRYSNTQLHIYHSKELTGPYRAHPGNPVKTDITSARPAGPLFWAGVKLYRPAQNCSLTYGGSLAINHIHRLTPEHFEETTVKRLHPSPDWPWNKGLHHLAFVDGQIVIDAKTFKFNRHHFSRHLALKLGIGL